LLPFTAKTLLEQNKQLLERVNELDNSNKKNPKEKKEEQHPAKVFGRFHSAFWVVAAEGKDWFRLVGRIDDRVRQRGSNFS
jgi:hypothetical protein